MLEMPVSRITVSLGDDERAALGRMAAEDTRYPKQQIAWLIRQEAQRRGLLPATNSNRAGDVLADTGAVAATTLQSRP